MWCSVLPAGQDVVSDSYILQKSECHKHLSKVIGRYKFSAVINALISRLHDGFREMAQLSQKIEKRFMPKIPAFLAIAIKTHSVWLASFTDD
jgi:hypothetical protein